MIPRVLVPEIKVKYARFLATVYRDTFEASSLLSTVGFLDTSVYLYNCTSIPTLFADTS